LVSPFPFFFFYREAPLLLLRAPSMPRRTSSAFPCMDLFARTVIPVQPPGGCRLDDRRPPCLEATCPRVLWFVSPPTPPRGTPRANNHVPTPPKPWLRPSARCRSRPAHLTTFPTRSPGHGLRSHLGPPCVEEVVCRPWPPRVASCPFSG